MANSKQIKSIKKAKVSKGFKRYRTAYILFSIEKRRQVKVHCCCCCFSCFEIQAFIIEIKIFLQLDNPGLSPKEILSELVRKHTLAIVTYGKKQFQLEKLKKAGIDTSIFSRIVVSESKDKKPHYQALLKELDIPASEVLVCGDRIHRDLSPAKELGFKTVHLRWGRGLGEIAQEGTVDFSIAHLSKLKVIVNHFENT